MGVVSVSFGICSDAEKFFSLLDQVGPVSGSDTRGLVMLLLNFVSSCTVLLGYMCTCMLCMAGIYCTLLCPCT
jgi:hypothetical protein